MSRISQALLQWYDSHARVLPWRGTKDPYRIWLSEIMLQQTRTETVAGYYGRFLRSYPTVQALADASEDSVFKLWEGLGYYSRARNLHKAAKIVAYDMGGTFPLTAEGLKKLPGIGPYASNAIASIAYNEHAPALDGNQARVISRLLAYDEPMKTPFDLEAVATEMLDSERPGDHNQALMDLGATICTPRSPNCTACPLAHFCKAATDDPERFPVKQPKPIKKEENWQILPVLTKDGIVLRKRPDSGLLAGLYEFASAETETNAESKLTALGFNDIVFLTDLPPSKHVFTHKVWNMTGRFYWAANVPKGWIAVRDFDAIAMPTALRVYRNSVTMLLNDYEQIQYLLKKEGII